MFIIHTRQVTAPFPFCHDEGQPLHGYFTYLFLTMTSPVPWWTQITDESRNRNHDSGRERHSTVPLGGEVFLWDEIQLIQYKSVTCLESANALPGQ
jgi:hypothetical protein